MIKYFIIDETHGSLYLDEMKARTRLEAIREGNSTWNALSAHDRKERSYFYVVEVAMEEWEDPMKRVFLDGAVDWSYDLDPDPEDLGSYELDKLAEALINEEL